MSEQIKYVAQGLMKTWKESEMPLSEWLDKRAKDSCSPPRTPLMHFLKYNYEERYVKLCRRLGVTPQSFGAWLRKPIESIV